MLYCPKCDAEYRDERKTCAEDGTELLPREAWEAELARQGRKPLEFKRLTAIASFLDQFKAEELAVDLAEEGISVAVVSTRGATVGVLTQPELPAWQIVVGDADAERAAALVAEWTKALDESAAEAEKAAEAEEAGGEAKA